MAKPKLFVADYDGYAQPFLRTFELTQEIKEADCLMFTGGSDILPSHYGEKEAPYTYTNPSRDKYELEYYEVARSRDIPIIGICRGAQLLCALAGGKLVQDVTGHTRGHQIHTKDGQTLQMTSLHHQMMRPEDTEHDLIAWTKNLSKHYWGEVDDYDQPIEIYGHLEQEPDIVYFKKNRGLAFQGHPEMLSIDHPTVKYCNELVREYLL